MPEYLKRTGRDVTDDILVRVPESEKSISRLVGPANKRLGIDRGSIPSVAAPLEGQMMIQYADEAVGATPVSPQVGPSFLGETPYYYSNGEWRPFCISTSPATGFYNGTIPTISAAGSDDVSFAYASGAALFDLTSPTAPEPLIQGVYAVTVSIGSGDSNFSADSGFRAAFLPYVSYYVNHQSQREAGGRVYDVSPSLTWGMGTSQAFRVEVFNNDLSNSHDFFVTGILAQLVYPY